MPRGGSAPGERRGGRRKGTPNKKNALAKLQAKGDVGELPHEFLLRVSRGGIIDGHQVTFEQRTQAAAQAAPYYAPKLAAIEHDGKVSEEIKRDIVITIVDPKKRLIDLEARRAFLPLLSPSRERGS